MFYLIWVVLLYFASSSPQQPHSVQRQPQENVDQGQQDVNKNKIFSKASDEHEYTQQIPQRQLQSIEPKNIRIQYDYSNLDVQDQSSLFQFLSSKLIPAASQYITNVYKVVPKLAITELKSQTTCTGLKIPSLYSSQIEDYDLVIFVGTKSGAGETWVAKGATCVRDSKIYRPVAGSVTFNQNQLQTFNLDQLSDFEWSSLVTTFIHEMNHVLGFSESNFVYFLDPTDNSIQKAGRVIKTQNARSWIVLPKVVKYAQQYFNCPSLWGLPLENDGGSQTVGDHWERRTFGNEAMTGSDIPGAVFSNFTLLVMEGSGWYTIDYKYAQTLVWGYGEGCPIAQGQCSSSDSEELCSNNQNQLCSVDYMGPATCKADAYTQGCKYWQQDPERDCRIATNETYPKGQVGVGSRCWVIREYNKTTNTNIIKPICLKSYCSKGNIYFQFDNINFSCSYGGQTITFNKDNGFTMLYCPFILFQFCAYDSQCPNACNGRGNCINNQCICWPGFSGSDCTTQG